ncbi:hypothetical protein [Rhodovulum kholense]|uniref:Uncharacterized protein n=1 Tax=Rhodovulum kholense TaxID=453584 RepID=A0A8E2VGI2_9RHOB|nr:hypothetical protein [Rhodovulum kholense]PTW43898.1 hypothetical protein C8N38_12038 [Rhodovulum kholense]
MILNQRDAMLRRVESPERRLGRRIGLGIRLALNYARCVLIIAACLKYLAG